MKQLAVLVLYLIVPIIALAQQYRSLEIFPETLTPIQQGGIVGIPIDKISLDPSKRPCARIKIHINRMSREEIAELKVEALTGGIAITKSIVASEGNGLIIELTAKPETRFYLHHDKYGDSNEVTLNLEGNKEYRLEAEVRILQSIVISTNTIDASIYLDDNYIGTTQADGTITIPDISLGMHKVNLEYGESLLETYITVDRHNIHFQIELEDVSKVCYAIPRSLSIKNTNTKQVSNERSSVGNHSTTPSKKDVSINNERIYRRLGELVVDYDLSMGEYVKSCKVDLAISINNRQIKCKKGLEGDYGKMYSSGKKQIHYDLSYQRDAFDNKDIMVSLNVKNKDIINWKYCIMPSISIKLNDNIPTLGIMIGYVKRIGGYIRLNSNFGFKKASYSCNSKYKTPNGGYIWTSGDSSEGVFQIKIGGLYRVTKWMYPYVGIGYGVRNIYWCDTDSQWAKVTDLSLHSIAMEAGLIFKCGPITVSPGFSTIGFQTSSFDIGIGVMF